MEDKNNLKNQPEGNTCSMCSCPCPMHGKMGCWCGYGGHGYWIVKIILIVVVLGAVFSLGVKLGELKSGLYGYGSRYSGQMMRGYYGGYRSGPGMMNPYYYGPGGTSSTVPQQW